MNPPSAGPLTIPSTREERAQMLAVLESGGLDPSHPCFPQRSLLAYVLAGEHRRSNTPAGRALRVWQTAEAEDMDEEIRLAHLAQDLADAEQAVLPAGATLPHSVLPELDGAA